MTLNITSHVSSPDTPIPMPVFVRVNPTLCERETANAASPAQMQQIDAGPMKPPVDCTTSGVARGLVCSPAAQPPLSLLWGDQCSSVDFRRGAIVSFQLRPPTSPSVPAATRLPRPRGSAAHAADGRKAPAQEKQERTRGCRRRGGRRCGCWGRDAGSRRTGSACRRGVRVQAAVPRVPGFAEAGWRLLERRA